MSWSGQSDGVKLFAEETSNDDLELVLQFTDDNSNGLSIRNSVGDTVSRMDAYGNFSGKSAKAGVADSANAVAWTNVTGKPSSYYTLPVASSTTLGGVKVGGNISLSDGTISLTKQNVTSALGYTPQRQTPTMSTMAPRNRRVRQSKYGLTQAQHREEDSDEISRNSGPRDH